jgi:hypothetical protein
MKKAAIILAGLFLSTTLFAGFKVKNIKPKKPERFQAQATVAGVTYAADLLLERGDQKTYFYKALVPFNLIAVRLDVVNTGKGEVVLPLDGIELLTPDSKRLQPVSAELVAGSVVEGKPIKASTESRVPQVGVGRGSVQDPRRDPSDPRYDPRMDPNSPHYDPMDPRNSNPNPPQTYPPQTYPPGTSPRGTYPPGTYPPTTVPGTYPSGGTMGGPGVVLNPGGGGGGEDLSQIERELAEKDFDDKAHTSEPILGSMSRDRFLYFSFAPPSGSIKGYVLRIPVGKGIPQEVVLEF